VSSNTSTPLAAKSDAARVSARLWRAVEAQHVASTRRLVDNLEEQRLLEDVLESTKPPVPASAQRLHYLLFTPFRYPAPHASRFRAIQDPGIFYGGASVRTACAELGFWRWRFLQDSKGLTTLGPAQQTLFEVSIRARAIDLERAPHSKDAARWRDPHDYSATQAFARSAREKAVSLILYASVRDPQPGRCGAVLHPDAFSSPEPTSPTQTWLLTVTADFAIWHRDREAFEFDMRRWIVHGK